MTCCRLSALSLPLAGVAAAVWLLLACWSDDPVRPGADPKADPKAGAQAGGDAKKIPRPTERLVVAGGFETPESALHDADADVYLVSNIRGDPFAPDNDGFISRVRPDGRVEAWKWIAGGAGGVTLNAPKGMAITGGVLYVADIDTVRAFDARTGAPKDAVRVPGASFLNDVTAGPDGRIYVSDTGFAPGFGDSGTDAIYEIKDGRPIELYRQPDLEGPNGLHAAAKGVYFVCWRANSLRMIDAEGQMQLIGEPPAQQLDGLVRRNNGDWLMSSWDSRAVFVIRGSGEVDELLVDLDNPADIGYDAERDCLLIPLFDQDSVLIHPLEGGQ